MVHRHVTLEPAAEYRQVVLGQESDGDNGFIWHDFIRSMPQRLRFAFGSNAIQHTSSMAARERVAALSCCASRHRRGPSIQIVEANPATKDRSGSRGSFLILWVMRGAKAH
ncbi:hypothetical protein SPHINGOAX6_30202 [Sphingomonas sp. AX6]|nr:hypothetical protein SPHINGOAX6_30202 [Sphingomonas sp. AX6]